MTQLCPKPSSASCFRVKTKVPSRANEALYNLVPPSLCCHLLYTTLSPLCFSLLACFHTSKCACLLATLPGTFLPQFILTAYSLNIFKSPPQALFLNVVFSDSSSPPYPSSRFTFFNSTNAFLIFYLYNLLFNLVSICLSPLESKLC